ncbi:ornithine cyclodeaminase family protein [Mesorhizobium sp. INR15]|uniref:ornithine cyclodeaminase family protein n=1 Tax=Mesorhizobium sp. INR15 TaxID=2654248 RepID=UPI0018969F71|nr:ornithine cyclodeaminase family protein [Mesorhizobium sp. INR15]QPC94598.1 ornithine cyclodeaminase family protein [Mesorhizobium sp. INR15]
MSQQPIVLNESDIAALLPRLDIRSALERMFRSLAEGAAVQPPQMLSLFPHHAGDFITYQGVLANEKVFGAKLSPYIPADGKALVTAWTLLMSTQTGMPVLLCDSKKLTTERTAATSIIAADVLATQQASVLTIVGSGQVAMAHLRYAETIRDWKEIRIASPNIGNRADIPARIGSGCSVTTFSDANKAIDGADVVMLCTSSGKPVIDAKLLAKTAVVTSISTNVANAHEVDPAALAGFDVYCDYRATTPASAGEMKLATASGAWDPKALRGDLPELLTGRARAPSRERPAFFRSIGLGLEDIAAAVALLAIARA